jgi:hypothetical protein
MQDFQRFVMTFCYDSTIQRGHGLTQAIEVEAVERVKGIGPSFRFISRLTPDETAEEASDRKQVKRARPRD